MFPASSFVDSNLQLVKKLNETFALKNECTSVSLSANNANLSADLQQDYNVLVKRVRETKTRFNAFLEKSQHEDGSEKNLLERSLMEFQLSFYTSAQALIHEKFCELSGILAQCGLVGANFLDSSDRNVPLPLDKAGPSTDQNHIEQFSYGVPSRSNTKLIEPKTITNKKFNPNSASVLKGKTEQPKSDVFALPAPKKTKMSEPCRSERATRSSTDALGTPGPKATKKSDPSRSGRETMNFTDVFALPGPKKTKKSDPSTSVRTTRSSTGALATPGPQTTKKSDPSRSRRETMNLTDVFAVPGSKPTKKSGPSRSERESRDSRGVSVYHNVLSGASASKHRSSNSRTSLSAISMENPEKSKSYELQRNSKKSIASGKRSSSAAQEIQSKKSKSNKDVRSNSNVLANMSAYDTSMENLAPSTKENSVSEENFDLSIQPLRRSERSRKTPRCFWVLHTRGYC